MAVALRIHLEDVGVTNPCFLLELALLDLLLVVVASRNPNIANNTTCFLEDWRQQGFKTSGIASFWSVSRKTKLVY
jgi:hypothetical protein